jgi:hypothetical protein
MSFRSAAHLGGVAFRPLKDGLTEISATITLPDGYVLGTADRLRFFRLGANTQVHELSIRADELDTGTNTLTLNVGYEGQSPLLTAYASASTVGQAGGIARLEPTVATPAFNYTVTVSPAAAANANVGVKRITATAVIGPANVPTGLLGDRVGAAYDHGRPNPAV